MKLSILLYTVALASFFSVAPLQNSYAGKNPNTLKSGISYVWLSDYDSQGLMFYNSYAYSIGKRAGIGANLGLLNASRYDATKEIYSIKNTFYIGSLDLIFQPLNNESVAFRLGAGPAIRHRAEINSNAETGTVDGSVKHIKASDVGFNGYIENDFNILKNGVAGGRVEYFYFTEGTPVFSIGLHLGFKF